MNEHDIRTLSENNDFQKEKIVIKENHEPLIKVEETARFRWGYKEEKIDDSSYYVRRSVAHKLHTISESLPPGINLVLVEGYRSIVAQQKLWDQEFEKLKNKNPSWANEEIEKQVRVVVARPHPLANHHCGGAVDVMLVYTNGSLVDMGGSYVTHALEGDRKKFPMLSKYITVEQAANRKILRDVMTTADFAWYTAEWWHYCWGDRMWAVYTNQIECFYGSIEFN